MDQHPVPQNIASYEFRLVGDMTLKQFIELASGLVVALLFYASGLPGYFKWPLVFVSSILGVGLAFLPIEERPLETWLMAFFKTIYSPTQYLWKKTPKKPEFLEERPAAAPEPPQPKITPQDRVKLTEYLSTLPENTNPLDQKETDFINQVQNLFSLSALPPKLDHKPIAANTVTQTPNVRKLSGPFVLEIEDGPVNTSNSFVSRSAPMPLPYIPPPVAVREPKPIQPARFAIDIPFPSIPTISNLLTGRLVDKEGRLIENVILEIKDQNGNPVRALRTNKIGQFQTVTQLANGPYEVVAEKEGYTFDPVRIELKGEIVQPIEMKAK